MGHSTLTSGILFSINLKPLTENTNDRIQLYTIYTFRAASENAQERLIIHCDVECQPNMRPEHPVQTHVGTFFASFQIFSTNTEQHNHKKQRTTMT